MICINVGCCTPSLVGIGMCKRLQAGKPSHYVTGHPGQLSLAILPRVIAASNSEDCGINSHITQCTIDSPVSVISQHKLVSAVTETEIIAVVCVAQIEHL